MGIISELLSKSWENRTQQKYNKGKNNHADEPSKTRHKHNNYASKDWTSYVYLYIYIYIYIYIYTYIYLHIYI